MTRFSSGPARRRGGWKGWLAALLGGASAAQAAPPQPATPPAPPAAPAAPQARAAVPEARLSRSDEMIYKTTSNTRLRLHFAWPSEQRFSGPRPCVVFFHGGGWRTGQPKQFMTFAERLAELGVVGISAQYRLMRDGDVLPMAAIQDARSALRFVRAKAAQLGCDPNRIAAGGGSSGGHLAAMTAVLVDPKAPAPAGPIDDPADDLAVSARPNALFLMNAPLNLERYERPVPADQRRQLSPALRVDAQWPPTWVFHGTADKLVPFAQAGEFRDRVKAAGGPEVAVQGFNGRGHGFFNANRGDGKDFDATLATMVAALKKLGWIA